MLFTVVFVIDPAFTIYVCDIPNVGIVLTVTTGDPFIVFVYAASIANFKFEVYIVKTVKLLDVNDDVVPFTDDIEIYSTVPAIAGVHVHVTVVVPDALILLIVPFVVVIVGLFVIGLLNTMDRRLGTLTYRFPAFVTEVNVVCGRGVTEPETVVSVPENPVPFVKVNVVDPDCGVQK